jgi:hypothetical protein
VAETKLHRFWFQFENLPESIPLGLGCGVSAWTQDDALNILNETVLRGLEGVEIVSVEEDVDVQTLDQDHIVRNMGDVTMRGIWFPVGYS